MSIIFERKSLHTVWSKVLLVLSTSEWVCKIVAQWCSHKVSASSAALYRAWSLHSSSHLQRQSQRLLVSFVPNICLEFSAYSWGLFLTRPYRIVQSWEYVAELGAELEEVAKRQSSERLPRLQISAYLIVCFLVIGKTEKILWENILKGRFGRFKPARRRVFRNQIFLTRHWNRDLLQFLFAHCASWANSFLQLRRGKWLTKMYRWILLPNPHNTIIVGKVTWETGRFSV
jgi:hypothetical protein